MAFQGVWTKFSISVTIISILLLIFWFNHKKSENPESQITYSSDPGTLSMGQQLFDSNCSSCHNFSHNSVGPSLANTTKNLSMEWLVKFIRNAPEMISIGDPRAKMLFDQYKQVMPSFNNLSDEEIEAILAFIHKNRKNDEVVLEETKPYLADPIPERIPLTGGRLYLRYHSIAPATGVKAPLARINKLQVLEGEKERMFVIDLEGILYEINGKKWNIAINIRKLRPDFESSRGLGTGFGSFAFHPEFHTNKLLYTTHAEKYKEKSGDLGFDGTVNIGLQWVLTEWHIENPSVLPFQAESREVLRIDMLTGSHGVQEIAFNPYAQKGDEDYGLLYICVGDGGAGEKKGYDHLCNSLIYPSSAVLRIDPLGKNSENGMYGIPPTNPFVNDTNPKVLKEIYCRGFRNPNRISWTLEGKMLISDIGQSNIEEINIGLPGADYGWPEREGTFMVDPKQDVTKVYALSDIEIPNKYTYPVLQYDHDEGRAISGGYVYNGSTIPSLRGKYIFADITNGRFFLSDDKYMKLGELAPIRELELWIDNEATDFQQINGTNKPDTRLGIGLGGEIYVFTKADGRLYEVIDYKPYQ